MAPREMSICRVSKQQPQVLGKCVSTNIKCFENVGLYTVFILLEERRAKTQPTARERAKKGPKKKPFIGNLEQN